MLWFLICVQHCGSQKAYFALAGSKRGVSTTSSSVHPQATVKKQRATSAADKAAVHPQTTVQKQRATQAADKAAVHPKATIKKQRARPAAEEATVKMRQELAIMAEYGLKSAEQKVAYDKWVTALGSSEVRQQHMN